MIRPIILSVAVLQSTATDASTLYVYDLNRPAVELPGGMASGIASVVGCEARGDLMRPYGIPGHAVNRSSGARGQLQVHPIHAPAMARLGLDYTIEYDRVLYAVRLWESGGWAPWSCIATEGKGHD